MYLKQHELAVINYTEQPLKPSPESESRTLTDVCLKQVQGE